MLIPSILYLIKLLYKLNTLCLNRTLSCVDFMDVIMGDIPMKLESVAGFLDTLSPGARRTTREGIGGTEPAVKHASQ